jgi:hypothetical protein
MIRTAICWSSLFTPRAISYRLAMGFPHDKVLISVGVQKMANARTAGVMFTLNPSNGDRSSIAIDASWGLGESVVWMVTPDNFLVNKITLDVVKRTASPKLIEYIPDPDGARAEIVDVPPERQNVLCMSDPELVALAQLGKKLEQHYGAPQDIEWAIDHDLPFPQNVVALQCRPETVWSRKTPVVKPASSPLDYVVANLLSGVRTGAAKPRDENCPRSSALNVNPADRRSLHGRDREHCPPAASSCTACLFPRWSSATANSSSSAALFPRCKATGRRRPVTSSLASRRRRRRSARCGKKPVWTSFWRDWWVCIRRLT